MDFTKETELLELRGELIGRTRLLDAKANEEKRHLTGEEQEQWDKYQKDVDGIEEKIEGFRKAEKRTEILEKRGKWDSTPQQNHLETAVSGAEETQVTVSGSESYRKAFGSYLRRGRMNMQPEELAELRALQIGTDSEGGFLAPDESILTLIQALEDNNIMRRLCTVIRTGSGTSDIPVVSSHGVGTWTAEEAADTLSDEAFTQVTLGAYKVSTIMKVSEELLNDSAFNLDAYITSEYGRRIGKAEETAFVTGTGSGQPSGVDDSSTLGVTAAATGAITTDELIDLFHSLGRPYRPSATWLLADATAKAVRKLKDGDNQYLWQPGLQAAQPDRLLGRPVEISDDMAAMTTGLKTVLFGDFSYYWIADRQGPVFQRLNELYAANGQVGFRAFQRVDGKLTLAVAVQHLIQA